MTYHIGIDPATSCGWAVLNDDGTRVASGAWKLERRRGDGAGMLYVRFERLFRELLEGFEPAVVAYEQIASRFAGSAHIGLGLQAHIQRICEETGVAYTGIPVSTIKKAATGKGNAGKDAMVASALAKWPGPIDTDDEADALWIAETERQGLA